MAVNIFFLVVIETLFMAYCSARGFGLDALMDSEKPRAAGHREHPVANQTT